MNPPIALVGAFNEQQSQTWLKLLNQAMPEETILVFEQLTGEQKQQCEIAIVANPNPDDIAQLPNLIWLHSLWAGVEKLVAAFKHTQLRMVRLIDPNLTEAMSEAVLTWSLYLHRDMPHYLAAQRDQRWHSKPYVSAQDRTIGVLGLGELGQAAAQRLAANHFNVLGWSRTEKTIDGITTFHGALGLDQVVATSDIIVVLVPLTDDTYQLINKDRLANMKPSAGIINFARGAVIDSDALLAALDNQQIDHAVLDVFEQEPLRAESPFWQHRKVTVLPHISAQTTPESASVIVAKNIKRFRQTKQIPATVNFMRGY